MVIIQTIKLIFISPQRLFTRSTWTLSKTHSQHHLFSNKHYMHVCIVLAELTSLTITHIKHAMEHSCVSWLYWKKWRPYVCAILLTPQMFQQNPPTHLSSVLLITSYRHLRVVEVLPQCSHLSYTCFFTVFLPAVSL